MTDPKHPAVALADTFNSCILPSDDMQDAAALLRTIPALEAKAARVDALQADDTVQFRGVDDSSEMLAVRKILESKAVYLDGRSIAAIVQVCTPQAQPEQAAQGVGDAALLAAAKEAREALAHVVGLYGLTHETKTLRQLDAAIAAHPAPSPAVAVPMSKAASDVLAERQRQVNVEGWTPEHDDEHSNGEMAEAAACYALLSHVPASRSKLKPPYFWPWAQKWWKPSDMRRDLIKAAALAIAEIERLDRAALATQQAQTKGGK